MKTYQPVFLALALCATSAFAQNGQQPPQINISGTADVKVAPDQVAIRFGVESRNENLNEATRAHEERMRSALQFLKLVGVPDKDIQTDFINIMPEYNGDSWHAKAAIFIVRESIEVNLTNIAKFQTIMTGLLTNGVDHVNGIEFRTSQLRKYRDEARAQAIHAAREKADALCAELGVKRGRPININANESGGFWNPYSSWWGGQGYGFASNAQVVVQNANGASDENGDTIALGQIKVSATVNVSFAIE